MEFIIATRNVGKLKEFKRILEPMGFTVISQVDVAPGLEVEETGTTFAENAYLKAKGIYDLTGKAAIADDSGLCVDALEGRPGVYSARYGGAAATDEDRVQMLLSELGEVPEQERTARFISAICCILPNGQVLRTEGSCEGKIGYEPKGENGFGYDPVFMIGEKSLAEMSASEKDSISHRGQALRRFEEQLTSLLKLS